MPQNIERLNGQGVCQIECGAQFSLALTKSGVVWTWYVSARPLPRAPALQLCTLSRAHPGVGEAGTLVPYLFISTPDH